MVSPIPKNVRLPTSDENEFIAQNLLGMKNLLGAVHGEPTDISPQSLDLGYAAWIESRDPDEDPTDGILLFGIAFCQCIADEMGMVWKIATDEEGAEPVIHKEAGGDVYLYPMSIVGKRLANGETNFFTPLFPVLCASVTQMIDKTLDK